MGVNGEKTQQSSSLWPLSFVQQEETMSVRTEKRNMERAGEDVTNMAGAHVHSYLLVSLPESSAS